MFRFGCGSAALWLRGFDFLKISGQIFPDVPD